ncbi:hypothetical protein ACWY4P_53820 (plasmid) [Streptomyces sp. LZ34]
MAPSINGNELTIGDDLGRDTTPDCCDVQMTATDTADGYRNYTCGDCATVLSVAPSGLIFDITD